MANMLLNAAALDGGADWTGSTSRDDAVVGAPGKAVFVSTGGAIYSNDVPVTAGKMIDTGGLYFGTALTVQFRNGGTLISAVAVPLRLKGDGAPRRGLAGSFDVARGRILVPVGATTARLRVDGPGTVYLLRPRLETTLVARERHLWQPGAHSNIDLNLPVWPIDFPTPRGFDADPIATRGSFAGDAGVPITRRKFRTRRYLAKVGYDVTEDELDRLMKFFDETSGPFWYSRPDSRELCRARWTADGEPKPGGLTRGGRGLELTLLLEVA